MASDKVTCKQGCGRTFKEDGAWRVKHELQCKGKVQTRGRIERLASRHNGTTAATAPKATKAQTRGVEQDSASTVTPAAMLAALRAEAAKIQNAIAAIEALG